MSDLGATLAAANASFNGLSLLMLLGGFISIRARRPDLHRRFMTAALAASAVFLVLYLWRVAATGTVRFEGEGLLRTVYLVVLFTHMPLAALVVPMSLRALYLALKGRFEAHRRIARVLFPVWTYVSVTGVTVYFMLYHLPK